MKIRLRPMLAAGITLALCVFAANIAWTPAAPAASAGMQQDQVAVVATAWMATPRLAAPANGSWEALMHASWR